MKMLLDRGGMSRLHFCMETSDYRRWYVANAAARCIVVFDNGLDPESLTGAVVKAEIGQETGLDGQVWPGYVGQPHSKISACQRVNGPPDHTLSNMLDAGRQD